MRDKLVHICIKSDAELLHRLDEDYRCSITKMALAAYRTGADIYAYSVMSNHIHIVGGFPDLGKFVSSYRNAYSKWFNHKYKRSGMLGERYVFVDILEGLDRKLRAVNYVLRNPVHHSVSDTSFSYDYCSARYVFRSEMHFRDDRSVKRICLYMPRCRTLPEELSLGEGGMVSPISFLNVEAVENLYLSVKNFLYMINRPAYSDLGKQDDDGNRQISLGDLEHTEDIELLYQNERRRSTSGLLSDLDVCGMIEDLLPVGITYCQLCDSEKARLACQILKKRFVPKAQLQRCLASGGCKR